MLSYSEQEVLTEICQGSRAALQDIHSVLSKVYDEELALDLNRQAAKYSRIQEKAASQLLQEGIQPAPVSILSRTKRWGSLQMGTALNVSTEHIAEILSKENGRRLEKVRNTMKETEITSKGSSGLAEEFIDFEQQNLRILESYCSFRN